MPPATFSKIGSFQPNNGISSLVERSLPSKFKSPIADLPINTSFYVQYATACKYVASQMIYQQPLPSQEYCTKLILESIQDISLCFLKGKL